MARPTVSDVARRAGVSRGTVSKALNDTGQLSPETRHRVRVAAAELGFEPNPQARSLTSGRTFTVGLLTSDSIGRFSIPMLQGVEDALGADSIRVLLCDARGDTERERKYVRTLLTQRVDGIIVTAKKTDVRPGIGSLPVPVVYAYAQSDQPQDRAVLPDDVEAGRLAVGHLVAGGRRRVAYVTGPAAALAVRNREDGARAALEQAGLGLPAAAVRYGEWSEEWGREAAAALTAAGVGAGGIDAVFCGSDQIGRGVAELWGSRQIRRSRRSIRPVRCREDYGERAVAGPARAGRGGHPHPGGHRPGAVAGFLDRCAGRAAIPGVRGNQRRAAICRHLASAGQRGWSDR